MSITDELRKWAKDNTLQNMVLTTYPPQHTVHGVLETLLRIADRIDAEHERVRAESIIDITDESMAEHGWIRLPKDRDGEHIHVGDVMEWPTTRETFEVVGIGDGTLFYVKDGSEKADWTGATTKRHHHAPTVEDVLRDYASRILIAGCIDEEDELVAEFAKRLKLAGDEE